VALPCTKESVSGENGQVVGSFKMREGWCAVGWSSSAK
jgi:hypothetical protein